MISIFDYRVLKKKKEKKMTIVQTTTIINQINSSLKEILLDPLFVKVIGGVQIVFQNESYRARTNHVHFVK